MLRNILLGYLSYGPMTGYQLKHEMDSATSHFWHAYHSQIYTTLRKLEDEGLVVSAVDERDDKLDRRMYTLTDAGKGELARWLQEPLMSLPLMKDDLLVRLFFSASRRAVDVLEELRVQRRLHQQRLDTYRQIHPEQQAAELAQEVGPAIVRDGVFWNLTLEMGLAFEQMYIDWIDSAITRIEQL
jgi:PadR family transcriptional regulator AphA